MRFCVAQPSGSGSLLQVWTAVLKVPLQPTLQAVRSAVGFARQPFSVFWQVLAHACPGRKRAALWAMYGEVSGVDACCLAVWNAWRALPRHCFVTDVKAPASGTCSAKLDSATRAAAATAKRRVILVF